VVKIYTNECQICQRQIEESIYVSAQTSYMDGFSRTHATLENLQKVASSPIYRFSISTELEVRYPVIAKILPEEMFQALIFT
jgi:hypothetical protein